MSNSSPTRPSARTCVEWIMFSVQIWQPHGPLLCFKQLEDNMVHSNIQHHMMTYDVYQVHGKQMCTDSESFSDGSLITWSWTSQLNGCCKILLQLISSCNSKASSGDTQWAQEAISPVRRGQGHWCPPLTTGRIYSESVPLSAEWYLSHESRSLSVRLWMCFGNQHCRDCYHFHINIFLFLSQPVISQSTIAVITIQEK